MQYEIHNEDALEYLRHIEAQQFDSLVTDPPSSISFMGNEWDSDKGGRSQWVAWLSSILTECNRVLKPGAYALVWALPRRSHWTCLALEDSGFEIRDVVTHLFGNGFPKSRSLLKPASEHWILCKTPGKLQELQIEGSKVQGRYPANLMLTHSEECEGTCLESCPVALLEDKAQFFYCGKAKAKERNFGLEGLPEVKPSRYRADNGNADHSPRTLPPEANFHPTVKPLQLMRYLIRLVTPPGGNVLDPFAGSGSTGIAAIQEGFDFCGVEVSEEYFKILSARLRVGS